MTIQIVPVSKENMEPVSFFFLSFFFNVLNYVITVLKIKILSAHDKGSHAEVNVKIKKVLQATKLKILRGKRTLYPESWTNRGCTCPILNPGEHQLDLVHRVSLVSVHWLSYGTSSEPNLLKRMSPFTL